MVVNGFEKPITSAIPFVILKSEAMKHLTPQCHAERSEASRSGAKQYFPPHSTRYIRPPAGVLSMTGEEWGMVPNQKQMIFKKAD